MTTFTSQFHINLPSGFCPYLSASLQTELGNVHCQYMLSPIRLLGISSNHLFTPFVMITCEVHVVKSNSQTWVRGLPDLLAAFAWLNFLCSLKHFLPWASKIILSLTSTVSLATLSVSSANSSSSPWPLWMQCLRDEFLEHFPFSRCTPQMTLGSL